MTNRSVFIAWLSLAIVGCTDGPLTPAPGGTLAIAITGLPPGVNAAITITDPSGIATPVTAPTTLEGIEPGFYVINAAVVVASSGTLAPSRPVQTVPVISGATTSTTVVYGPAALALRAQLVIGGLADPVYLVSPPGDSRLFVVEKPGRIRIIKNGALVATPFLDIVARVNSPSERGLLSMAFDPGFATNGWFYVYYTDLLGDIVVERRSVSSNPDVATPDFVPVITIPHQVNANHNGGLVAFGADGMLYLATGDGGGGGDPGNNAQNVNSLLGKLLRLNVATLPYSIPADNPFVNRDGADEIWAYGLRNPWRFAFDRQVSPVRLYIADVGQDVYEEVNVVDARTGGMNFGWRRTEGLHCYNPSSGCEIPGLTPPVFEYSHGPGCSITGGVVYRGAAIPELQGHYFYSDYCAGWLRSFRFDGTATDQINWPIANIGNVLSFGTDAAGEMYVLSANGSVYRIVKQ